MDCQLDSNCCSLGLSEQTDLTYKQIQQGFDNHNRCYIEYHGKKEKTQQGGLYHRKVQFKNVRHYILADDAYIPPEKHQLQANRDIDTNVAEIFSVYLSFISRFADADPTGDTRFYHRPLVCDKNGIPSFSQQVVG